MRTARGLGGLGALGLELGRASGKHQHQHKRANYDARRMGADAASAGSSGRERGRVAVVQHGRRQQSSRVAG
jgi:hypothetical protein